MPLEKDGPHITWLQGELAGWVKEGVIDSEAAERLRQRYASVEPAASRAQRWALILFGILGAVLIGGGIILLLAHNWDEMSRPVRVIVSYTPLVIAQALTFWVLWSGRESRAWRESLGALLALLVGACIALISQTYNMGGQFADFMLAWTLLSLPVAYLLRATLPALWFCAAVVIWGFNLHWHSQDSLWFWPLLALLMPLWWMEVRENRYGVKAVLISWGICGAGSFGIEIVGQSDLWHNAHWALSCGGWFTLLYLVGRRWFAGGASLWQRPMQVIGLKGSVVMALILTFQRPQNYQGKSDGVVALSHGLLEHPLAWLALFGWALAAVVLWVESLIRKDIPAMVVGALPLLILMGEELAMRGGPSPYILFNVYLFAAGVAVLVSGLRKHQLGTVNGGMAIIAVWTICRFFDSDMPFVWRGLVFIVLGAGFLFTNVLLLRQKGTSKS